MNVPYSEEAERSVLGAVLIQPKGIYAVRSVLDVQDFYLLRNGYVYGALLRLAERDEAIDNVTVCRELLALGQLEAVGGPGYITQLIAETPTAVHRDVYAEVVKRAALRRKLMVVADEIKALAVDEARQLPEVMADISGRVFEAVRDDRERTPDWYDLVNGYTENMGQLWETPGMTLGVPTGLRTYDAHTLGLHKGEMTIVAGRPGMGKTVLLMGWLLHMAQAGYRVGMWSGEMSQQQMIERMAANLSGIPNTKLRKGEMTLDEKRVFLDTMARLSELPIHLWTGAMKPGKLKMKVLEEQARRGLDVLIVDYIGLMQTDGRVENETAKISALSWALKDMAMSCGIPVVVASQLNRGLENRQDKRPQLFDLRSSGSLEQDADVVLGLYRDVVYDEATMTPDAIEIAQLKNRHGEPVMIQAQFDGARSRIVGGEMRKVRLD